MPPNRVLCPTCERPPGAALENKLITALSHIPPGFHVQFGVETSTAPDGSPDGEFLGANVFQEPPDGGWSVRDVDLKPVNGWSGSREPGAYCTADKFRDRVLFGITAATPDALERLLVHAIMERWPAVRPGLWGGV